jgi:tetratricopeptide (TPR) repeat protein
MNRILMRFTYLAAAARIATAVAQQPAAPLNIFLKDGRVVTTPNLARSGSNIMTTVSVGAGSGQVGYPVDSIARIDFAEPPQLNTARTLLAQGKIVEAQALASVVMNHFAPYRDVPGSFWADAAALSVPALVSVGREQDADRVIADMVQSPDVKTQLLGKVQQAASGARKGRHEEALVVYDEAIAQSTDPETLAVAWLNKGHSLLASNQWEPALLAYLRLPVLYPDRALWLPPALLGSARAFEALEDFPEAEARLNALLRDYPESPSATAAKAALERLKKKQS